MTTSVSNTSKSVRVLRTTWSASVPSAQRNTWKPFFKSILRMASRRTSSSSTRRTFAPRALGSAAPGTVTTPSSRTAPSPAGMTIVTVVP